MRGYTPGAMARRPAAAGPAPEQAPDLRSELERTIRFAKIVAETMGAYIDATPMTTAIERTRRAALRDRIEVLGQRFDAGDAFDRGEA